MAGGIFSDVVIPGHAAWDGVQLYLATVKSTFPRRAVRLQAFIPRHTNDRVQAVAEMLDGERSVQQFGADRHDVKLRDVFVSADQALVIEQMARDAQPVTVYGPMPPGYSLHAPLCSTLNGDPESGAQDGGGWRVGSGDYSKAYVYLPDNVSYGYAAEFDPEAPLFVPGLLIHPPTAVAADTYSAMYPPFGRAFVSYKGYRNLVPNALFGDVSGSMPVNWTADGLDEYGVSSCGWNSDIAALFAAKAPTGAGEIKSDKFDVPTDHDEYTVTGLIESWGSCTCRLSIRWFDGASVLSDSDLPSRSGCVLEERAVTRPAAADGAKFVFKHGCGFARFSMPQFIHCDASADRLYAHQMFIGGGGEDNVAWINGSAGEWTPLLGPVADGFMYFGFVGVPDHKTDYEGSTNVIFSVSGDNVDEQMSLYLTYNAGTSELRARLSKDWIAVASVDLDGHEAGDFYAWSLVVKNDASARFRFVRLDDTGVYTASVGAGALVYGDRFRIGNRCTLHGSGEARGDLLHSSFGITAVDDDSDELEGYVSNLAKPEVQELYTRTQGRAYLLRPNLKRDPFNPGQFSGDIDLLELLEF